ncbi:MAG: ATP-dependent Clp protease ATP-binding subunit ClpX, partial [bacterium]
GLDSIIEQRIGKKSMGFKADVKAKSQKSMFDTLEMVQPGDLIRYGLIPEFVGRLPVIGVLGDLDRAALVKILTEPRNALVKQYQKIFEYENVTLTFTKDALEAIAEQALQRKIGARGLRLILEDLMLDLMYQLPSRTDITECVITKEVVENKTAPIILMEKAG